MSTNSFKVRKSVVVLPESSPTLSDQGELAYDSVTDKLKIRNTASTDSVVQEALSQTLTNKSIDSDTNTLSNIKNADIKSTAAIAYSKLAALTASKALQSDGSGVVSASAVTSTELGYVSGVTSAIQTQLNNKPTAGGDAYFANLAVTGELMGSTTTDGASGSSVELNNPASLLVKLSSASLVSIAAIVAPTAVAGAATTITQTLIIRNSTGVTVSLLNNTGGSSNANRLLLSSGVNLSLLNGAAVYLIYDASTLRWRDVNGASLALPSANIFVGNATGAATAVAVTGDVTLANTGDVQIASGVIVDADVNTSAAILGSKLATNATFTGDTTSTSSHSANGNIAISGTAANIPDGSSSSARLNSTSTTGLMGIYTAANSTADANASGSVSIETGNKTAGTGDSGTIQLKPGTSSGGARGQVTVDGVALTLSSVTTPATPASTYGKVYFKSDGFLYQLNDAGTETKVGAGSGGINYILNPDAESNTTGWATYKDAAQATPVDGTGGSPTLTFTRSTSSPLRGTGSFLVTTTAANLQGEGASYDFTISSADQGKVLSISFDYTVASGTYADGDMTVYIYDVTNTTVQQPAGYSILNAATGFPVKQIATFQTASNSTSYRLILHRAVSTSSAMTMKLDNVIVGPQTVQYGAPITDWGTNSWTPTGTWVSNTTYTGFWRRVGDSMEATVQLSLAGAPTATNLNINLPSGYTIDTNKTFSTGNNQVGFGSINRSTLYPAQVIYNSTTSVAVEFFKSDSGTNPVPVNTNTTVNATNPGTFANGDKIEVTFIVPIVGWSSSVQMSTDTDTRVVAAGGVKTAAGTTQSGITSATEITLNTTRFDTHAAFATNGRFTAPVPGYYECKGSLFWQTGASAPTEVDLYFLKNGTGTLLGTYTQTTGIVASASRTGKLTAIIYLNAGDYVSMWALAVTNSITIAKDNNDETYMYVERLSGPSAVASSESVNTRYYASSTSISSSLATISWTTKDFDSHNGMSSGTYTVPVSGKYQVNAALLITGTIALNNNLILEIQKNSSVVSRYTEFFPATLTDGKGIITDIISCLAGDTIRLQASSTVTGPSIVSSNFDNYISISRVGN